MRRHLNSLLIRDHDDIEAARARAFDEQNDELLCFVEVLRFALSNGTACFPAKAEFPEPPDVLMTCPNGVQIAVEASRVGWTRQHQVIAGATARYPGAMIELSRDLCHQKRAEGRLTDRTGNYDAIRRPHEKFNSPGFAGDEAELLALEALQAAIDNKHAKIDIYKKYSCRVWLFFFGLYYHRSVSKNIWPQLPERKGKVVVL